MHTNLSTDTYNSVNLSVNLNTIQFLNTYIPYLVTSLLNHEIEKKYKTIKQAAN